MGPDLNKARPNPDVPGIVYIKNVVKNPNIIVGDYTYYFDATGRMEVMKRSSKGLLALLFAAVLIFGFTACGRKAETTEQPDSGTADQSPVTEGSGIESSGLWENALYIEDTEIGGGSETVVVEVRAEERSVRLTIHTDEDTVGAALLANGLIAGDESEYGLYIKAVNGIIADYNADRSYWAFYIDGEYAMAGVDSTDITEGVVYQLVYTK